MERRLYSKHDLPTDVDSQSLQIPTAYRVEGAFRVVGPAGKIDCDDGYVAVDSAGNAFAIPAELLEAEAPQGHVPPQNVAESDKQVENREDAELEPETEPSEGEPAVSEEPNPDSEEKADEGPDPE